MSGTPDEDARLVELTAINRRLKTVMSFLKSKHSAESLAYAEEQAARNIQDFSPAYVHLDGVVIEATRHLGALLQLSDVLELRHQVGQPENAVEECATLLERKVEILQGLGPCRT